MSTRYDVTWWEIVAWTALFIGVQLMFWIHVFKIEQPPGWNQTAEPSQQKGLNRSKGSTNVTVVV